MSLRSSFFGAAALALVSLPAFAGGACVTPEDLEAQTFNAFGADQVEMSVVPAPADVGSGVSEVLAILVPANGIGAMFFFDAQGCALDDNMHEAATVGETVGVVGPVEAVRAVVEAAARNGA